MQWDMRSMAWAYGTPWCEAKRPLGNEKARGPFRIYGALDRSRSSRVSDLSHARLAGTLARVIHEESVNNPGLPADGHSRGGMTPGGRRTGYRSRVPRLGCGLEMPQGGVIRPGSPISTVSVKPALFASRVRE